MDLKVITDKIKNITPGMIFVVGGVIVFLYMLLRPQSESTTIPDIASPASTGGGGGGSTSMDQSGVYDLTQAINDMNEKINTVANDFNSQLTSTNQQLQTIETNYNTQQTALATAPVVAPEIHPTTSTVLRDERGNVRSADEYSTLTGSALSAAAAEDSLRDSHGNLPAGWGAIVDKIVASPTTNNYTVSSEPSNKPLFHINN